MAVKIRMMRIGRRHRPFFRINVIDGRAPRDGRIIEKVGHYDPIEKDKDKQILLNTERIQYWLDQGAIPSETVGDILIRNGMTCKHIEERKRKRDKARQIAKKKGRLFTKADRELAAKRAEEAAKAAEEAAAKAKAEAEAKAKAEEEARKKAEEEAKAAAEAEQAAEAAQTPDAGSEEKAEG